MQQQAQAVADDRDSKYYLVLRVLISAEFRGVRNSRNPAIWGNWVRDSFQVRLGLEVVISHHVQQLAFPKQSLLSVTFMCVRISAC